MAGLLRGVLSAGLQAVKTSLGGADALLRVADQTGLQAAAVLAIAVV